MTSLHQNTLNSIHTAVAGGNYSYEQLMHDTLDVIKRLNPTINAIVALQNQADLMKQAQRADQTPALGALHGIPIAIKDLVNVAGIPTSSGSPIFKNFIPQSHDLLVSRILDAGAIVIGKTNTPEFGFGSQTYNPVHGATATPYNLEKTSGGSSGGAAAALGAGMLTVADGSDMMGSLRNPAAFCNVYGFRPTYGVVPNEPKAEAFMHQLATLGPMARTVEDLAQLLDVIAGSYRKDPHSVPYLPSFSSMVQKPLEQHLRIAWLADWGGLLPIENGITDLCESALSVLEGRGHKVEKVSLPIDREQLWQSWLSLRAFAIASSLAPLYQDTATCKQLKPEAIFEIETGLALSGEEIAKASAIRTQWLNAVNRLFEEYDVLTMPSCQVFPFDKNEHWPSHINDVKMSTYHRWMEVVIPVSLIGLPALNVPVGFSDAGLPMGMQLIGALHDDAKILQLGQQYHLDTLWPQSYPPKFA